MADRVGLHIWIDPLAEDGLADRLLVPLFVFPGSLGDTRPVSKARAGLIACGEAGIHPKDHRDVRNHFDPIPGQRADHFAAVLDLPPLLIGLAFLFFTEGSVVIPWPQGLNLGVKVQCAGNILASLDKVHTGTEGLFDSHSRTCDRSAGRIQPDHAGSLFQALARMLLDHTVFDEQCRTMAPGEVSPQAVEDLLAVTEGFDRQDKLGEKSHPKEEE